MFDGEAIPPYAIASHRWTDDEATYVDVLEHKNKRTEGYKKIKEFCDFTKWRNRVVQEGHGASTAVRQLNWIWIDTCCIDQRSSAEVAENIISMYKYYEQCAECYAYLSDVSATNGIVDLSVFEQSRWFTRGWTLQELLAPDCVFFIQRDWRLLGHKCSESAGPWSRVDSGRCHGFRCGWSGQILNAAISNRTGISTEVLSKQRNPKDVPPDQICKWIEKRKTRREEDRAYCLLGLLGVYILPMYGEGVNAWSRLKDEVSKKKKTHGCSLSRPAQLLSDPRGKNVSATRQPLSDTQRRCLQVATLPQPIPPLSLEQIGQNWREREQTAYEKMKTRHEWLAAQRERIRLQQQGLPHMPQQPMLRDDTANTSNGQTVRRRARTHGSETREHLHPQQFEERQIQTQGTCSFKSRMIANALTLPIAGMTLFDTAVMAGTLGITMGSMPGILKASLTSEAMQSPNHQEGVVTEVE